MSATASPAAESTRAVAARHGRLLASEPFAHALAAAGIETLDDVRSLPGGQRLDKATLPWWRERLRIELPGIGTCYLKRYSSPPIRVQVRRVLSGHPTSSTARLEWERIRGLKAAGIEGVTPVALGEEMVGPWERRSALITAALPGESLEKYAQRCPQRVARDWISGLARFVAGFHGGGFVHRDLYLCHIFVEAAGAEPAFRLLDLARMIRPRLRRRRWVVKDLASLNYSTPPGVATASDRLRFLKAYLGVDRLGGGDRRLIRRIAGKTRRIARHDARLRQAARTDR